MTASPRSATPGLSFTAPATRYQGSKRKLLPALAEQFGKLHFETALDAFGGSASVSYLLKRMGKAVTFNDYLKSNWLIGQAVIENDAHRLTENQVESLVADEPQLACGGVIERHYADIYFTDDENRWLDRVAQKLGELDDPRGRALAFAALSQACIIKRPYNLFHRKNLYMRLADVPRSFGNKAAWDRSFPSHFREFVREYNRSVFAGAKGCQATCRDARDVSGSFDLVYLDPPYINGRGAAVDYFAFYHFLEGLADYPHWEPRINHRRKHRPLHGTVSPWSDPQRTRAGMRELFDRYRDATLVLSYRSDGIPSEKELLADLRAVKRHVEMIDLQQYQYALSKNRRSRELLFVAR